MSGGSIVFPYGSWRKGQRELAEEVRRSVSEGELLLASAPTGFGKTAAVIYGLLSAEAERVLYLVRTVNEIDPVVRELKRFGARFTFLFSARRMCPLMTSEGSLPSVEDFWGNCRIARAKGVCSYYEELSSLDEAEVAQYVRSRPVISAYRLAWDIAKFKGACPFFALKGLVEDSQFIVATYPYLFKEDIFRSFLEPYDYGDFVAVVDEAHSLLNIHSLHEYRVSQRDLDLALKEVKEYASSARDFMAWLESVLEKVSRLKVSRITLLDKQPFLEGLDDLSVVEDVVETIRTRKAEEALSLSGPSGIGRVKTISSRIYSWLSVLVRDDSYLFAEKDESGMLWLIATPLDPSRVVKEPLEKVKAAVLLSGTMPSTKLYMEVLGVSRSFKFVDVNLMYGARGFGRFFTIVAADVTTAYRSRGDSMYRLIASRIAMADRLLPGLKLAVYPSYEVMYRVVERLPADVETIVETRGISLDEVEAKILARDPGEKIIINAVAGGKLVEGVEFVDYEGRNLLSTVIVVGVPFPQPDDYTRKHLEVMASRIGVSNARKLVYLVNPMIKVRQALGRGIRGPEDRALYILMDYRYLRRDLKEVLGMPYHRVVKGAEDFEEAVKAARSRVFGG
ncbi:putative DNA repair helicase Rad3 [Aeropyrum pernix]|uniref:Putative DNA repair helicase Rad3 n=1 Tax=Aeropyrum pernix TaxID=56636 RepID=A0A401HBP2_AERPX|nr:ATP-dependent DNA helicase [Aeropyrum pernix]GBF09800.1 putative DNA repair helicase Rad3 [Aeropyrum pernix]